MPATDLADAIDALKGGAKEVNEYVTWLEGELRYVRRELHRATRNRWQLDKGQSRTPIHTGLAPATRAILSSGNKTRAEIEQALTTSGIEFSAKSLGVMLSQNFRFDEPTGCWQLGTPVKRPKNPLREAREAKLLKEAS